MKLIANSRLMRATLEDEQAATSPTALAAGAAAVGEATSLTVFLPARLIGQSRTPALPRDAWKETAVMVDTGAAWTDIYTGKTFNATAGRLLLDEALATLPVAVLKASGT